MCFKSFRISIDDRNVHIICQSFNSFSFEIVIFCSNPAMVLKQRPLNYRFNCGEIISCLKKNLMHEQSKWNNMLWIIHYVENVLSSS